LKINEDLTDQAVLGELGSRLRETRLSRNLSQDWLAAEAGVSTPTIAKLEHGRPVQLTTFIRVLRVLRLLGGLEVTVPEPEPSPIEAFRNRAGRRQRASPDPDAGAPTRSRSWRWADEL
jgi:transcriptional regulator with XRE-family HTH domain